jgi:hypothetical protein
VVLFGPLEGDAGVLEQVGARGGVGLQLDVATGEGHLVRDALDLQALAAAGHQGLGVDVAPGAQHAVGVAAHTGNDGVGRHALAQALCHGIEQQVTEAVAHHVVDGAEVVDVHQRQGVAGRALAGTAVQRLDEAGPVGQAHQLVVEGELVQALHQVAVAQQVADVDAEHIQQAAVGVGRRVEGVDVDRHVAAVAVAHVQGHAHGRAHVLVPLQGFQQHAAHVRLGQRLQRAIDQGGELAGGGQHAVGVAAALDLGADQTLGHRAQQPGQLRDDTLGKGVQAGFLEEVGAGAHDQLQASAVGLDGDDLLVGADRGGQRGQQLVPRQFGLGLVVVDVVAQQGLVLGGVARLAGAQHDAGGLEAGIVADEIDQLQAGVLGLHHHIQQHQGQVAMGQQRLAGLGRVEGVHELDGPPEDAHPVQGEGGGLVDIGIVVHHQHPPGAPRSGLRALRPHRGFVFEGK